MPRRRRPDAALTPFLLDRQSSARESIIGGLLRTLGLLLFGGLSAPRDETLRHMNAATRTAYLAMQSSTWHGLDVMAGETARGRRPEVPTEPWSMADLDQMLAKGVEQAKADLERHVRDIMDEVAAEATQAHGDATQESDDPVIGYRRVPHPELSDSGTCGLCAVASHKFYKRGNLKKIHDWCKCETVEVRATSDPGGWLNDSELSEFYDRVDKTYNRSALSHIRIERNPAGGLTFLDRAGNPLRIEDLRAA